MNAKHFPGSGKPSGAAETLADDFKLDRTDRQILKRLQVDGRGTISQLAEQVNLSLSACSERVKRLEAHGFIEGYYAQLNAKRLGLGLLAYIQVSLDRTSEDVLERFTHAVHGFDEILECQMVGGGFDYLVKVRVKDMPRYRTLLSELVSAVRGVQQTHTYFVMEEVKASHRLPV